MEQNRQNIVNIVMEFIDEHRLIDRGDRLLLSLSAGKDSMALLDIMIKLREYYDISLAVFHLNHMMRGAESDADETFLAETIGKNDIRLFIERYNFKEKDHPGASFEEFARAKRYELLRTAAEKNGFNKMATAHSLDDNIETVVMRIFKGTGIHGLKGITFNNNNVIRPMLCIRTAEIYDYLRTGGIAWREDSSNRDNRYLRNYVRNILLPEIGTNFKNAGGVLQSLSKTSDEYTGLIDDLLTDKYKVLFKIENDNVIIKSDRFIRDRRIFKYIIAKAIREHFKYFVSYGMLEEIYKNAVTDKAHLNLFTNLNLNMRKTIIKGEKIIIISKTRPDSHDANEWEYNLDIKNINDAVLKINETGNDIIFDIVDYQFFKSNFKNTNYIFVDVTDNRRHIAIRNRRSGDKIKLKAGTKKIKELFIDAKLSADIKSVIPIILIESKIAAILPGFIDRSIKNRVSSNFYVTDKSKKILAIHYI